MDAVSCMERLHATFCCVCGFHLDRSDGDGVGCLLEEGNRRMDEEEDALVELPAQQCRKAVF